MQCCVRGESLHEGRVLPAALHGVVLCACPECAGAAWSLRLHSANLQQPWIQRSAASQVLRSALHAWAA